jgi:hypothetical protein
VGEGVRLICQSRSTTPVSSPRACAMPKPLRATGCLKKGSEGGGYYITGKDGTMWELSSKTVNLSEHVNHTVSVSGHEMPRSQADETKIAESEKSESAGSKYADLKVAQLKMVSTSCTP